MRKLPLAPRLLAAAAALGLSGAALATTVYDADAKADWRAASALMDQHDPGARVVVVSPDPNRPQVDLATARYYLPPTVETNTPEELRADPPQAGTRLWVVVRTQRGRPLSAVPHLGDYLGAWDVPGLRLTHQAIGK